MKKLISSTLALLLCLVFTLSACDNQSNSGAGSESTFDTPLTLINYGREITLYSKPERVLTLGPNCTELFIALGLTDYIIGHSLADHSRGPLPEFADDHARIPELTFSHATREAIITSGADFIYGIDWEFGGDISIEELADFGIIVYENAAKTLEEQFQEIRDIGRIFQIEDRAEAFINDQITRIRSVENTVAGEQTLKVLVYDHGSSGVFTAGGPNFISELIGLAGGVNIFNDITDQEWFTASFEEVLAREPDVIIINDYDVPPADVKIDEIKSGVFSQLESVINERFIIIDLESILPGNRMAHTVEAFAAGFFPHLFT